MAEQWNQGSSSADVASWHYLRRRRDAAAAARYSNATSEEIARVTRVSVMQLWSPSSIALGSRVAARRHSLSVLTEKPLMFEETMEIEMTDLEKRDCNVRPKIISIWTTHRCNYIVLNGKIWLVYSLKFQLD